MDVETDYKFRLLLENNMRRTPSCGMGNRHVKRGETKIVREDVTNIFGSSFSQYLPTGCFH